MAEMGLLSMQLSEYCEGAVIIATVLCAVVALFVLGRKILKW